MLNQGNFVANNDTSFLNGFIEEDIYMTIPKGLPPTHINKICKLNKSLYGLKQSFRVWYPRLDQYLLLHKYQHPKSNVSIYII